VSAAVIAASALGGGVVELRARGAAPAKRSAGGVEAVEPAAQCAGTPATVDQSMEMQEIGWNCPLEGAHSVQLQMVTAQRS